MNKKSPLLKLIPVLTAIAAVVGCLYSLGLSVEGGDGFGMLVPITIAILLGGLISISLKRKKLARLSND